MTKSKWMTTVAAVGFFISVTGTMAQTQPDPHHPPQEGQSGSASSTGPQASSMMNMMGDMMKMMSGNQMQMGCMGMGMKDRVEGRIAFLRAELQITPKQEKLWEAFAEQMRERAAQEKKGNPDMMTNMKSGSVIERLATEEKHLSQHLEVVRAYEAALKPLYASFNDNQRRNADELLACDSGMMGQGMMGQGMMGSGMMQGMGQGQGAGGAQDATPMENGSQQ